MLPDTAEGTMMLIWPFVAKRIGALAMSTPPGCVWKVTLRSRWVALTASGLTEVAYRRVTGSCTPDRIWLLLQPVPPEEQKFAPKILTMSYGATDCRAGGATW